MLEIKEHVSEQGDKTVSSPFVHNVQHKIFWSGCHLHMEYIAAVVWVHFGCGAGGNNIKV